MRYRQQLPQLDGGLFLTDGGIETTLIYHEGLDLPAFAAFDLLEDEEGTEPIVIGGCVGPEDDGYNPAQMLTADAARDYHGAQVATFRDTAADMVTAITMTYATRPRANASTRSHAELDEATELDEGDPADLGARYAALRPKLRRLNVLGGCCGSDHRHVAEICSAWPADA